MSAPQAEPERLIQWARDMRRDIARMFADAAAWNDNSQARRIDPDPDGHMRRFAESLDRWLALADVRQAPRP